MMEWKGILNDRHVTLKVAVYVISVVALLSTVSFIATVSVSYRHAIETAHAESERSLKSAVELLDSRFERIEDATNQAAMLSALLNRNPESAYALLNHLSASCPELMAACIMFRENYYPSEGRMYAPQIVDFDGDGHYEPFDATDYGFAYLDGEDDNWNASSAGEKFWSRIYESRYRKNSHLFCYSVPMYDGNGGFIGIICAEVSLDFLYETMDRLKPSEESLFLIVSEDDDILCYSDTSLILSMKAMEAEAEYSDPAYTELAIAMHSGKSGMVEFTDPDETFAYYTYFPKCKWGIAFSYPCDLILATPRKLARRMIIIDITVLALLFVVLFFGILKIITPFSRQLKKTVANNASLENELRIAADIQKEMIPSDAELRGIRKDIDICAFLKPAKMVGGDLYDCYVRDGKLFFCLGDVSGKGMPAALFMAMTRSLFRIISRNQDDPAGIFETLNREICAANRTSMFCTVFAGVLELSSGSLSYCNAGHNPPVVIRKASAEAGFADVGAFCPIGAFDDSEFVSGRMNLDEGDILLLYTDGITEAENSAHSFFGEERLVETLSKSAEEGSDLEKTVGDIISAVELYSEGAEQSDDITMLAIGFRKNS